MNQTKTLNILITGAAGNIAYSLVSMIGSVFGSEINLNLFLLDKPEKQNKLEALILELEDCCFKNVISIKMELDKSIHKDSIDVAILMGGFPRKPGMDRFELIYINSEGAREQAELLNHCAKDSCFVLGVFNPVNTNTMVVQQYCPKLNRKRFISLVQLDINRATIKIAQIIKCNVDQVKNVLIWGNHSNTLFPDVSKCLIDNRPLKDVFENKEYFEKQFIKDIQNRGGQILQLGKQSAVISAVYAITDVLKNLYFGLPDDVYTSLGVIQDGNNYNIPKGICFAVPCKLKGNFEFEVVNNFQLSEFTQEKIKIGVDELLKEQEEALQYLQNSQNQQSND